MISAPIRPEVWPVAAAPVVLTKEARVRQMVDGHFDAVWRFVRRLGVASMDVEDAMQEVIVIAAGKLGEVPPERERAFLFGVAFRVASEWRRFRAGRREVDEGHLAVHADPLPEADALLDQARARTMLDEALAGMPLDLRAVFTLYELEELTMAEIAELLGLAPGTAASRLRRAREHFEAHVARLAARMQSKERPR